jgi:hypothetical protein
MDRTDSIPAVFVGRRTYVCRNYPLFMLYVIGSLIPLTKVETSGDLKFEIEKDPHRNGISNRPVHFEHLPTGSSFQI